jgi:hypothetical protein
MNWPDASNENPRRQSDLTVALADPPETLLTACNAGFVDIEWVTEDLTQGDVQSCLRKSVPRAQTVPLQAFLGKDPPEGGFPAKPSAFPAGLLQQMFATLRVTLLDFLRFSAIAAKLTSATGREPASHGWE